MSLSFGIDLDGVVWEGKSLIAGSLEAISLLRSKGDVRFLTNNSAKTKSNLVQKFKDLSIFVREEEIFTSGYSTLNFVLANKFKKISLVADLEIEDLYKANGLTVVPDSGSVDAVVVHFSKNISYELLAVRLNQVISGAKLIGCNRERVFPSDNGRLLPGCGPFLAAIETGANVKAVICGKPEVGFLSSVMTEVNSSPSKFYMIGDSIESDIAMGKNLGVNTVLIESNGSAVVDDGLTRPDFRFTSLLDFAKSIN